MKLWQVSAACAALSAVILGAAWFAGREATVPLRATVRALVRVSETKAQVVEFQVESGSARQLRETFESLQGWFRERGWQVVALAYCAPGQGQPTGAWLFYPRNRDLSAVGQDVYRRLGHGLGVQKIIVSAGDMPEAAVIWRLCGLTARPSKVAGRG